MSGVSHRLRVAVKGIESAPGGRRTGSNGTFGGLTFTATISPLASTVGPSVCPLTCGNAGQGPLRVPGGGIQNGLDEWTISAFGRRTVTCANVQGERARSTSAGNAPVSSGPRRRAGRTHPGADLRRCQGWGYAMTADLQAIAIEQRWCQSCPSGNLPTAGQVPWLGGPVRCARQAGVNCAVRRAPAGIFTRRVLRTHPQVHSG